MKKRVALLLLMPGSILLIVFLILPLVNILFPTIFNGGFTLDSYISYLKDEYFIKIFIRTLKIAVISTLVCMVFGVPTAYYISRCNKNRRGLLLAITFFPLLTNSVIRSFAWINILGRKGIVNTLLMNLGIIEKPLTLLYTEFSIIIGSIYLFLPLMIITTAGIMENIDNDMMEAAESLGANRLLAFIKVILPISLSGIIVGSVLVFTGTLTAYTTPQLLGGNKNLVLATFIYQKSMSLGDWTGASVIAAIMIITTIIVIKVFNLISKKIDKRGEEHA
jgi:putative spermidine/putrescine transport system permease protein